MRTWRATGLRCFFYSLFTLLFLSSCIPLPSTGNGEPYTGYSEPSDPNGSAGKQYEAKALSSRHKVLVSYHDQGLHEVSVLRRNSGSDSYSVLSTQLTVKKDISGARVYETESLKVSISPAVTSLELKLNSSSIIDTDFNPSLFDCSGFTNKAPFAAGLGTKINPYVICTAEQLNNIRGQYLNSYFVLWSPIDLSSYATANGGKGWEPIGTQSSPFAGNFDGNLFAITGLKIDNVSTGEQVGLFGVVTNGGVLGNMNLVGVLVRGKAEVGALVGEIAYAEIINVHTSGEVYSAIDHAGGVIGLVKNRAGTPCEYSIARSSSATNVQARSHKVGGLVGAVNNQNCSGFISDSSTSGTIKAGHSSSTTASSAGGIAGLIYYTDILRCHSSTNVSADRHAGGMVGSAHGGSIRDSFHNASVVATDSNAGGILGTGFNDSIIERSYSTSHVSAKEALGGILGQAYYTPKIYKSFFAGNLNYLTGINSDMGGLVGYEADTGNVTLEDSYWFVEGKTGTLGCIGNRSQSECNAVAVEIDNAEFFHDPANNPLSLWNFESVWEAITSSFPILFKVY
jgi:hypothetical protein